MSTAETQARERLMWEPEQLTVTKPGGGQDGGSSEMTSQATGVESFPVKHGKDGRFLPGPHTPKSGGGGGGSGGGSRKAKSFDEVDTGKLSEDEDVALTSFAKYRGNKINDHLRSGRSPGGKTPDKKIPDEWDSNTVARMDSAMKHSTLSHDVDVYRVVHDDQAMFGSAPVGKRFRDKGFVSTTTRNPRIPGSGAMSGSSVVHLKLKKGDHAVKVPDVADPNPWTPGKAVTNEIVLPRGSTYKVTKVTGSPGYRKIEVEVVNGGVSS